MSEEEKCRIRQIRAYADEYVNELENEVHSEFMQSIMKDAIEDAVNWADSHPKNKIEKELDNFRNPWISVEKEQPTKTDVYYVRTQQKCADMAYYDSSVKKWEKGRFTDGTVAYWMLIPQIEKGE